MAFLPTIPRDPPARLRLMSLWFALFAVGVEFFEIGSGNASLPMRIAGLVSVGALGVWLLWGYRRRGFPEYAMVLETLPLIVATAATDLPLRAMGLFLAVVQFRSLYVSRREFVLLPVSYGVARVIGMALTMQPAPYAAISSTVLFQFIGLLFISGILFMLMQALEGQARAEAQLRDVQKMEAVGQLAGGIAHDFNNLLTVIGGHVFMIEQTGQLAPSAVKHLDGITQTAERAGSLTRQLLAFGRRQMLHPTTVDLNAVVRDAARLLSPVVGERISLLTDLDASLPAVHADVGQLEQVLLNLGLNARDAMPKGGTLSIRTSTADAPTGPQVCVTFEDTGIGMNAETAARVFEPFFTTKRGGRGTGLGLATAYGIIKQSSGDITVSSTPGKGSVFTITLPVIAQAAPVRARVSDPAAQGAVRALGVARVLLVEDNDGVRDFAREVLTRSGVKVSTASDGNEGLAVAREQGYAFDLVLTDVVMPGLSGPQMIERLRESRPSLPVVYMTGYADDAVTARELRAGRELLIEKPFSARVLRSAIRSIVAEAGAIGNSLGEVAGSHAT